jgi:hypothetical protein
MYLPANILQCLFSSNFWFKCMCEYVGCKTNLDGQLGMDLCFQNKKRKLSHPIESILKPFKAQKMTFLFLKLSHFVYKLLKIKKYKLNFLYRKPHKIVKQFERIWMPCELGYWMCRTNPPYYVKYTRTVRNYISWNKYLGDSSHSTYSNCSVVFKNKTTMFEGTHTQT